VSFRRVVHMLVGSSLLVLGVLVVLAPGSSSLAGGTSAPEIKQFLSCVYESDGSLDPRYDIYWDPQPNDGDVRVTTASRGTIVGHEFDGFGHSVRESVPGPTAGPITNTITGTFTDPVLQVRVPFTTTVTIVLNADCVAHPPTPETSPSQATSMLTRFSPYRGTDGTARRSRLGGVAPRVRRRRGPTRGRVQRREHIVTLEPGCP
jgi:hypothetical protein